ncbi:MULTISPECIES: exonuclease SbcCD subunit D C-terminal domain-containing protein [unclassified Carboxylicivirga]|uniref:exonuclease SbcCD subunit D C-terminal domain-containing protein n=1 Tax=Carboxylicivirga TaxID=1628153 RepID=UPI003D32FB27
MRILHTSDWHIGQKLHGYEREDEHRLFFQWLKQLINEQYIDVLLVAGDIFDVGFPSNNALKLYYNFLTSLIDSHCKQVIITGGNHDYISTLEAPSEILAALNVRVVGGAREELADELVIIDGQDDTRCVVAAVPFLRDKDLRQTVAGESYADRVNAMNQGIVKHYEAVAEEARAFDCPVIGMGHLYVQGAGLSDSERDVHIGNLAGLSVQSFPASFDYMALGHIHRPQKLNEEGTIRYSGSPLPLSFSERRDNKQVILLDVERSGVEVIRVIGVPTWRRLVSFKGSYADVAEKVQQYQGDNELDDWGEVQIEEAVMDTSLRSSFDELVEASNTADNRLQIIKPTLRFTGAIQDDEPRSTDSLNDLQVEDVFQRLMDSRQVVNQSQVQQTFSELMDSLYHQGEND